MGKDTQNFPIIQVCVTQSCVTQSCVNYKTLITKYIINNFGKIEVASSCFGKTPNLMSFYTRMTKKPKKNVVIKKSCTFAVENEYYLFTLKLKTMQEILNEIVPIIAEKLGVDPSEVTMEASFTNDLGADSLDTVELMMEFEKSFNLSIPDDQQESIVTVGDVVRLIEKMRAENN